MKMIIRTLLALAFTLTLASGETDRNGRINLNGDWRFKRLDEASAEASFVDADDSAWETVSLPHSAYLEPLVISNQWQGVCWYRKTVDVPVAFAGKKIWLTLEGAMSQSKIWVNGKLAKERAGGYLPVVADLTDFVKPGKNEVAIRLDSRDNPLTGPKPVKILDFCMYSGLYRNVHLTVKEKVYISHPVLADKTAGGGIFITFPQVSEEQSTVSVKTHVVNENDSAQTVLLQHQVLQNGKVVAEKVSDPVEIAPGKDAELNDILQMENAPLWSPDTPNLHTLKTTLLVDGKQVDAETTRFGIRKIEFRNGHELYVNGKKMFLRGANRHQDYPFIGYALSDNAQYRDAKKMKDAGFNSVRLSHYPHSPAFMDACDELGLFTLDASMGWQYYLDDDRFREYCYRSSRELVRRDRNHPSVLAWEVSLNETRNMPDYFIEELHRIAHAEYPGPNTFSAGWIDHAWDIFLQARQHRILHGFHPNLDKPYFVSEYGDWEYYSTNAGLNQDKLDKTRRYETSSRQTRSYGEKRLLQQARNLQESHNDNLGTYAFGDGYWVFNDYNRGYAQDIEYSGVVDLFRVPKFGFYFYQSQRDVSAGVVLKIASWWTPESATDVTVFSNCDEIELYLNDKLIARQKPDSGANTENLGHPPFTFKLEKFTAGTLKAVGFIKGEIAAEDTVKTPGDPVELKLVLDECGVAPEADCNDVVFVHVQAVDENGTVVPSVNGAVDLAISGDAEVMNVGGVEIDTGIGSALVRVGKADGAVVLKAQAGDLKGEIGFTAR